MTYEEHIVHHLGGSGFIAMSGAYDFRWYDRDKALEFRIRENPSQANMVVVTAVGQDDFTMTFMERRNSEMIWSQASRYISSEELWPYFKLFVFPEP